MNKLSTSLVALLAVFGSAQMGLASESSAFEASVSVLSPDETGFIIGGQTSVNGLGSSSVVMSRNAAQLSVTGGAISNLDATSSPSTGYLEGVSSDAFINSALNFERSITTAGSLVGQGGVVARGEAIGSIGTAGAASASTSTAGVRATQAATTLLAGLEGGEGSASADSSAQGSLNGSVSTANTLQLLGSNGLFAGSNGLTVGETNKANAYGRSTIVADGTTGINLNTASLSGTGLLSGTGAGALFGVTSNLTSQTLAGTTGIELSVSNAGNGTISLTTSTGGFFSGGGFAGGASTHIDSDSFFSPSAIPAL